MAIATKTLNPLPLQDLEPHRFEDLVRQLAYDFRQWQSLEAIGRTGSDDGIDIRGMERVGAASEIPPVDDADGESQSLSESEAAEVRTWIIQCKREKSLGPKDVKKIIADFFKTASEPPYGYVLAAACDFSKKSRDAFREALSTKGVQEFYLWGRGELEDMLVLPKNDHLLFAYFGISLQVRRVALRTRLRTRLALKRRLTKELGGISSESRKVVLIRDPNEDAYPFVQDRLAFAKKPRWGYWEFVRQEPTDHLLFVVNKFYAFADWSTGEWDFIKGKDIGEPLHPELWGAPARGATHDESEICRAYWTLNVPAENRGWLLAFGAIHFDQILALDELGDSVNPGPHLLIEYRDGEIFSRSEARIEPAGSFSNEVVYPTGPDDPKRVKRFPEQLPDEREALAKKLQAAFEESQKSSTRKKPLD